MDSGLSALQNPMDLPDEFKSWLLKFIEVNPPSLPAAGMLGYQQTADQASLYRNSYINVKDPSYGAKGDGVTDDTAAIQAAIDDWILCSYDSFGDAPQTRAVLFFPAGTYKVTATLAATFAHNSAMSKLISGHGAILKPVFSSGHALDITVTAGTTRNLAIEGLHIDGTDLSDTASAMIHLGGGTVGTLNRCISRGVTLESFRGDGFLIDGQSYEHQFYSCRLFPPTTNHTGCCYHITNSGGGAVSSIDIYGGTACNGLRGVHAESPQGGVKIYGGTWIQAYNEAIYFGNSTEGAIIGAHIENAWQGGSASPGWGTTQAGIYASGRVTLCGVTGTQNNSKMRYVARIAANDTAVVIGGLAISGCEYYLRAEGPSTANITVIGTGSGSVDVVHNGMGANSMLNAIGVDGSLSGTKGTATQATSKTTAVTINRINGKITMNNAALAAGATAVFAVNNSLVGTNDVVVVQVAGGFGTPATYQATCDLFSAGGGFRIAVKNISAGSLSEALVLNFRVIKGAN